VAPEVAAVLPVPGVPPVRDVLAPEVLLAPAVRVRRVLGVLVPPGPKAD
jgi:hypothetical protein